MLEEPIKFACVGAHSNSRIREQTYVIDRQVATNRYPRLLLRGAPISKLEVRIVTASNPCLATGTELVGQLTPSVAAGLACLGDSIEAPLQLASVGIVCAYIAVLRYVASTTRKSENDLAIGYDGPAGIREAFTSIGNLCLPNLLTGASIKRY